MWRNDHSILVPRIRRTLLAFAALFAMALGDLHAQPGPGGPFQAPDTLTTKDGKTISGRIGSLREGKINVETGQGTTSVEVESVADFTIRGIEDSETAPAIDPEAIDQILVNQQQILQRLNSLAVAFANLEQQLRSVQTNQVIQSRRMTERTLETDPVGKVVVTSSNIRRNNNRTVVYGQVMNQSESAVTNLQVQATLFGSRGTLGKMGGSQSNTGPVLPISLGPGQSGSFEVQFGGTYNVDDMRVDVLGLAGNYQIPIQALPQRFGDY